MAEVILEKVTKRFGEVTVVKGIDLRIADGEFMVLVGPSGCGKTTILRMVAGLEEVTEGRIIINGRVVNHVPPKDRDLAMVFQSYALYPHMNVSENMAFALKMRKVPKEEIEARVLEAARILGIEKLLARKPKQLSGGQRQRVALGRTLVRKPAVFLFDEPLSNLDAKLRGQMRAEISKLHSQLKTTSIYVTHDQVEAMTMGSKIAIVNEGLIQQCGTPLDIYEAPANKFVAGFIGSPPMNFFEAGLRDEGGRALIAASGFRVPWPGHLADAALRRGPAEYLFGIRPENLHDAEFFPGGDGGEAFRGMVEVVEPMGAETYVHLVVGGDRFVARVTPKTRASVGREMRLVMETQKIHVFDKKDLNALREEVAK
ncbi:MAG TPA: sn-glycerol-3-phosphate ABC transporter ATP-binding protein UgpC [Candidatus Aminicenantes bacterium]|nr:sn-glycerol-3-phosphate ABC transporter ATP-binding protein UgpC [Candidatus Aminicenantes bacterium]